MQTSISPYNKGSNEAATGQATCPYCGKSFACGGEVKKADGGEISVLGKKRDVELPRHQLDVYRGENIPRGEAREKDDEEARRIEYAREIRRRRGY